jgi:hypothetical protein
MGRRALGIDEVNVALISAIEGGAAMTSKLKNLKRLTHSKLSQLVVDSMIAIGIDSTNSSANNHLLIVTIIFFTLVSGATTYDGTVLYLDKGSALLGSIGIQSLLFATALLIASRSVSKIATAVYVIVMHVSVFFSYSSLLNHVYPPEHRSIELRERTADVAWDIIYPELQNSKAEHQRLIDEFSLELTKFGADVLSASTATITMLSNLENGSDSDRERLTNMVEGARKHEHEQRVWRLSKDIGMIDRDLRITRAKLDKLKRLKIDFKATLDNIAQNLDGITVTDINNLNEACHDLLAEAEGEVPATTCGRTSAFISKLDTMSGYARFWKFEHKKCLTTSTATMAEVEACLAVAPLPVETRHEVSEQLRALDRLYGTDVHYFQVAVGLLREGHTLAVLSLILALAFDLLVLLAGFLRIFPARGLGTFDSENLINVLQIGGGTAEDKLEKVLSRGAGYVDVDRRSFSKDNYTTFFRLDQLTEIHHAVGMLLNNDWATQTTRGEVEGIALSEKFTSWAAAQIRSHKDKLRLKDSLSLSVEMAFTDDFDAVADSQSVTQKSDSV